MKVCKGKNKSGGPCGMRPAKDEEWCLRHKGQAKTGEAPPAAKTEEPAKKKTVGDELSGAAAVAIGVGVGVLGLCAWLVFRPRATPAAREKKPRLTAVA